MVNANKLLASTDAQVWAEEFCRWFAIIGDGPGEARFTHVDDPEGVMIAWFANAIETGRAAGRAEEMQLAVSG